MKNYIDGFVFPIPKSKLSEYKLVAEKVASIWKEHGALAYCEYVGDDMQLEGTGSFIQSLDAKENEVIVFGWILFDSKETRDLANDRVKNDTRMSAIVVPLIDPSKMIFNAQRMLYGGFKSLVQAT